MKYCKNCGEAVKDNIKYCPQCGSLIDAEFSKDFNTLEKKYIKGFGLGFVLGFFLNLFGFFLVLFLGDEECKKGALSGFITTTVISFIFFLLNFSRML